MEIKGENCRRGKGWRRRQRVREEGESWTRRGGLEKKGKGLEMKGERKWCLLKSPQISYE